MLTAAQLRQFDDDGFVLVGELVDAGECARYHARFLEIAAGDAPDDMTVMRDVMVVKGAVTPKTPVHGINKIMNFQSDPVLYDYARLPGLLEIARQLAGEALYTISTNVFNKPPDVDGRHPLHQDLRYFRLRPPGGIVGVWTALSPCTRESGCLAVIPGTHRGPLRDHGDPDWEYVNHAFYGVSDVNAGARVHIEMAPGDTLFFHPLLVHGSGRNRSDDFRRAISVHYASADCTTTGRDWKTGAHVRRVA